MIHVEPNETHSIPPWWVVAGVKPEGPETDYGAYRTAGFSKSQQEQPLDQMKGFEVFGSGSESTRQGMCSFLGSIG